MKCKNCRYFDHEKFENTTLCGCNVLVYLIKKHHNKYLVDALVGGDDDCLIYLYLIEYFKSLNSID